MCCTVPVRWLFVQPVNGLCGFAAEICWVMHGSDYRHKI